MMRILIIQTTRMGDTLQTTPLIRALRRKHPQAHLTILVRNMGQAVMAMNPDVDEVKVYNEDSMFLNMRSGDSQRLLKAYREAEDTIAWIRDQHFEIVYNCTNSISSAMMVKLAQVPKVVGADMSDDWLFILRGRWPNYFFTSVFHREYNDLNLCDISGRFEPDAEPCKELVLEAPDEANQAVEQLLTKHKVGADDFVLCFQLGASEVGKRWAESHFAALGQMLKDKYKARLFLVGVESETPLGESFEKHAPGLAVHLFGKTSLAELAALLKRSNLLVTNDTGTMHIAAAVACPILLVSIGYVHFRETGPYAPGHCAIERRKTTLGKTDIDTDVLDEGLLILPEQAIKAIELTLQSEADKPVEQIESTSGLADVDIYMTRHAPDGCLQWYPVIRRPLTEKDFVRIAYRMMWLDYLESGTDERAERAGLQAMLRCYDHGSSSSAPIVSWGARLETVFAELAAMAQQGIKLTEDLLKVLKKKERMARAKQLVAQLVNLDEEMRIYGEINPAAKPLAVITRFERDNLEGMDPLALSQATLKIYRRCFARARLTCRKVMRVVETWKSL